VIVRMTVDLQYHLGAISKIRKIKNVKKLGGNPTYYSSSTSFRPKPIVPTMKFITVTVLAVVAAFVIAGTGAWLRCSALHGLFVRRFSASYVHPASERTHSSPSRFGFVQPRRILP
jgi:hypothetical protein